MPPKTKAGKARALANLRPPWKPGQSGNAGAKPRSGHRLKPGILRATLMRELRKEDNYVRLCEAWVREAIKGNGVYLRELLARVMPLEGQQNAQRVIMEGIRLELSSEDGKTISATMLHGEGPALPPPEDEPRDLEPEES